MNTPIDDGGPFFPVTAEQSANGLSPLPGVSLRAWLAGQALAGVLASDADYAFEWRNDRNEVRLLGYGENPHEDGTNWKKVAGPKERMAAQCCAYADAVIAALKGGQS